MSELHDRVRAELALRDRLGCTDVRNDMLRDLLAENERLVETNRNFHASAVAAVARAETAEARLRDLANAEPVGWIYADDAEKLKRGAGVIYSCPQSIGDNGVALIPRPTL